MSLAKATKNLKYDARLLEKNLATGQISKEEYDKHLASLPDLAHNTETFTIDGKNHGSNNEESH